MTRGETLEWFGCVLLDVKVLNVVEILEPLVKTQAQLLRRWADKAQGFVLLVMIADDYAEVLEAVVRTHSEVPSAAEVGCMVAVVDAANAGYNSAAGIRIADVGSIAVELPQGEEPMARVVLRITILFLVDTVPGIPALVPG
jgi:hypothetical protein